MDRRMRELEPKELEAVIGGALYGAASTAFRMPGRSPVVDAGSALSAGSVDPVVARRTP
jgi:hypothetical protein